MEHKVIPPTRGIGTISPELKLDERNIEIVQQARAWPVGRCERISVNAFGYGGANAHAIVDAAVPSFAELNNNDHASGECISVLLPLSAHHSDSMSANVEAISKLHLSRSDLLDVAYTLSTRSRLAHRGFMLGTWTPEGTRFSHSTSEVVQSSPTSLAFAFTGQGAQWPCMGRELLHRFPKYRDVIVDLDVRLGSLMHAPSWTIMATLTEDASIGSIYKADRSQTVCTAVQIALVELLRDFGVRPSAVVGHSSGEIGAAFTAGYISASEALAIAYYRGFVSQRIPVEGAMLAVGLSAEHTAELLSSLGVQDAATVACVNSPESTTVSGEPDAVALVAQALSDRNVFHRILKTDGKAYHSHLMKLVGEEYQTLLGDVFEERSWLAPEVEVQVFSSLTARVATRESVRTPEYWRANLESPVLFRQALELMFKSEALSIVEIGPHPALGQPIKDTAKAASINDLKYSYSLYRGKSDETCILQLLGQLYTASTNMHFSNINKVVSDPSPKDTLSQPEPNRRGKRVLSSTEKWAWLTNDDSGVEDLSDRSEGRLTPPLLAPQIPPQTHCQPYQPKIFKHMPTYAWHHQAPLWTESRQSAEYRSTKYRKHDLLGSRVPATPASLAIWRNQLRLADAPWIQHHRLGSTIVFPAAGYVAMAIEALLQVHEYTSTGSVVIRHMHLMNMLVLSSTEKDAIELSTVLEPEDLSMTTDSSTWWRFRISSYAAGSSTTHAKGRISIKSSSCALTSSISLPSAFAADEQATRTMYNRLAAQGLSFGPLFQSMKCISTDRHRMVPFAESMVSLLIGGEPDTTGYSTYTIHPITVDSLLQTAIVASCKGTSSELFGKVPVEIGSLEMLLDAKTSADTLCSVRASSTSVGFDAVQLAGELVSPAGHIVLKTSDVRAINYRETSLAPKSTLQRNPALRVLWKPDITTLTPSSSDVAREYARRFREYSQFGDGDGTHGHVAAMLDLLAHKYGRMNILELGEESDTKFSDMLGKFSLSHAPRKYKSYTRGRFDDSGAIRIHGAKAAYAGPAFDLIVVPSPSAMPNGSLADYLSPNGWLIAARSKDRGDSQLSRVVFVDSVIVERKVDALTIHHPTRIFLIHDSTPSPLNTALTTHLASKFNAYIHSIHIDTLPHATLPTNSIVLSTLEYTAPFLSTMTPARQVALTTLTESASILLWITHGSLFTSRDPEAATILGLARSVMLERPSLKMPVLDLCADSTLTEKAQNVGLVLGQVLAEPNPDLEFREHEGSSYVSRFVPDGAQNLAFRQTQDADKVGTTIGEVGFATLGLETVGQIDTLRFEQGVMPGAVAQGHVRVQVEAVGLNAKDLYALSDKINIKNATCGLEFSGTITSSGSSNLAIGDRVVVMAPHHFSTYADVPEWSCVKLRSHEDVHTMCTIPLVFSTALYALEHRARLEDGQSVLIHSAAGGLGIAAIQVARMLGAEIYCTVGTDDKREFLIEHFGIPANHVFDSRSISFAADLLRATSGRGVDVVLNSLTGDLLHESWEVLAPFGTFVEVGKRDVLDGGRLSMRVFERAATFTAFDLTDLYWSDSPNKQRTWTRLLQRSVNLVRSGQLKPVEPLATFPAAEIVQAFRHFASGKRIGKVCVSMAEHLTIQAVPFKYRTRFSPTKSYLLVGCLGGLGRSISRWMFALGARNFTFIGRSGTTKPSAARLVDDLTRSGATITVVQGSVADLSVVQRAIDTSTHAIGGVVQASMAIHVSLFKNMDNATWHAGLVQKIQGTWNLHNALEGKDAELDFFLMLSSITGSVGTATESNYCAANSFLDAFGSYRRRRGLPAVALGLGMISEVGFLHENPETEAALLRKGVHPFTEAELLQIIDISLSDLPSPPQAAVDEGFGLEHQMQGHILTGLELHGFQKIRDQGFVRGTKVLEDPRCTYIAGAFAESAAETSVEAESDGLKLPHAVRVALAETSGNAKEPSEALLSAIGATVITQISTLLLVPKEALGMDTLLADFGMESMLAAEFRSDMYRAFKVDVPFAILLERRTRIQTVVETIGRVLVL